MAESAPSMSIFHNLLFVICSLCYMGRAYGSCFCFHSLTNGLKSAVTVLDEAMPLVPSHQFWQSRPRALGPQHFITTDFNPLVINANNSMSAIGTWHVLYLLWAHLKHRGTPQLSHLAMRKSDCLWICYMEEMPLTF